MTLVRLQARLSRRRKRTFRVAGHPASGVGAAQAGGREPARVPWQVERDRHFRVTALTNVGDEQLNHVRLVLCGGTQLAITLPVVIKPGERLRLWGSDEQLAGVITAPDAMWVVRWMDTSGRELLWPFPPE